MNVPVKCMQCDDALVLPHVWGALYKDASPVRCCGQDKCIGCKACVIACPFGCVSVIKKGRDTLISICDLCSGDPECVKVCREKAIAYVDELKINKNKRKRTCNKIINQKDKVI